MSSHFSLKHLLSRRVQVPRHAGPSDEQIETQLHRLCLPTPSRADGTTDRISEQKVLQIQNILAYFDNGDSRPGQRKWYTRPRIYAILRTLGAAHLMDEFIDQGVNDFYLPFNQQTLPAFVMGLDRGLDIRQAFLDIQDYYLTEAKEMETESLKHMHFDNGDTFFTHKKLLGQGGFGAVDLVLSRLSCKPYARKRVVRGRDSESSRITQRSMVQELRELKRLDHRHLVKIIGSYTDKDYIAYLMEPIARCTLEEFLKGSKSPNQQQRESMRRWYGCLAGAVQHLHKNKIRHRDLTCRNILITGSNEVHISDFGTAYNWGDRLSSNTRHMNTHVSKDYMSPEVARHEDRGTASDMWSLGVVFLRMTTRLLGRRLDDLQLRIQRTARETNAQPYVYANMPVVTKWLGELSSSNHESAYDNEPIVWVRNLLQELPSNRQHAVSLMKDIIESPSSDLFCCFTCHGELRDGSFAYDANPTVQQSLDDEYNQILESVTAVLRPDDAPKLSNGANKTIEKWLRTDDGYWDHSKPQRYNDQGQGDIETVVIGQRPNPVLGTIASPRTDVVNSRYPSWRADALQIDDDLDDDDDLDTGYYSAASDLGPSGDDDEVLSDTCKPATPSSNYADFRDSGLGFDEYDSGSTSAEDDGRLFDEISDRPDSGSEDEEEGVSHDQLLKIASLSLRWGVTNDIEQSPMLDPSSQDQDQEDGRFVEISDVSESESGDDSACSPESAPDDKLQPNNTPLSVARIGFQAYVTDNSQDEVTLCSGDDDDADAEQRPVLPSKDFSTDRGPGPQATQSEVNSTHDAERTAQSASNAALNPAVNDFITKIGQDKPKRPSSLSSHSRCSQPPQNLQDTGAKTKKQNKTKKQVRIQAPDDHISRATPTVDDTITDVTPPTTLSAGNVRLLNQSHAKAETDVREPAASRDVVQSVAIDPRLLLKQAWETASSAPTSVVSATTQRRLARLLSPLVSNDNSTGGGVLLWACKQGDRRKLRYLLDQGCNPGTVRRPRPRAILAAASGGTDSHRKCVRELLKFDVNVNVRAKKSRKTPLHVAIANKNFAGYSKLVRMLVDAGADVNARDANKDHPLAAIFYDGRDSLPLEMHRQQVLAILLQADAEVNFFLVGTGDTPLHLAVRRRDAYAVAMLVFKGAHVHAKNSSGSTPLHITASQFRPGPLPADHAQVLQWLLRHGKDAINEPAGAAGRTALHLAASAGCPDAVAMLLEHGAAPLACDSADHTALELAKRSGDGDAMITRLTGPKIISEDRARIISLLQAAATSD